MIEYRTFLNTDPPALAEIWNDAFSGRGSVKFSGASPLETFVFAKPYFDPAGLIVAHEEGRQVGFAHVGFGPNAEQSALCTKSGVICLLGVRATYRRRGIGSELLRRCEAYLTERGAQRVFAGPQAPFDPFYFGLYGGAGLPGFLVSDPNAEPFFVQRGYQSENAVATSNAGSQNSQRLPTPALPHYGNATRSSLLPPSKPKLGGVKASWVRSIGLNSAWRTRAAAR